MLRFSRCAVGATFKSHTNPDLPKPLSEYFASRAKAILEIELDEPQVATVQGLAVLSSYEAASTRDTRAWVFSGMVTFDKPVAAVLYADMMLLLLRNGYPVSADAWTARKHSQICGGRQDDGCRSQCS